MGDCPDDQCSPTSSLPSGKRSQRKEDRTQKRKRRVTLEKGQRVAATRNVSSHTEVEEGNGQPCRHLELKQAMLTIDFSRQN